MLFFAFCCHLPYLETTSVKAASSTTSCAAMLEATPVMEPLVEPSPRLVGVLPVPATPTPVILAWIAPVAALIPVVSPLVAAARRGTLLVMLIRTWIAVKARSMLLWVVLVLSRGVPVESGRVLRLGL